MHRRSGPARYLTPLSSRAAENLIQVQLLYLLTVDPVSTHKRGRYQQTRTHTFSFHKTLGFNDLGASGLPKSWRGGFAGKWHNTTFKNEC